VITLQEFYYPASDSRTSTVISKTHLTGLNSNRKRLQVWLQEMEPRLRETADRFCDNKLLRGVFSFSEEGRRPRECDR